MQQIVSRMPNWLFNLTSIVFLLLFSVLALSPSVVFGRIDCKTKDGFRCPRMSVNMNMSGIDVKTMVSDGTGTFYIPVVSKLSNVTVDLFSQDGMNIEYKVSEPIEFGLIPVWGGRDFRITIQGAAPDVLSKYEMKELGGNWLYRAVNLFNFTKPADAAEIVTKEVFLKNGRGLSADEPGLLPIDPAAAEIAQFVAQKVSGITNTDLQASQELDLRKLSIFEIEILSQDISNKYNVTIDPSHWEFLTQVDGVASYVSSLQKIEVPENGVKSWKQLQDLRSVGSGEKFIFVP